MPGKPWLEARGDRLYCCYFHAGLRVYDISDQYVPKEIAYFIPPNPSRPPRLPGPNIACAEDLVVDERGYIFINCSNDGLYVLTLRGWLTGVEMSGQAESYGGQPKRG